jgi:hypothetical protein
MFAAGPPERLVASIASDTEGYFRVPLPPGRFLVAGRTNVPGSESFCYYAKGGVTSHALAETVEVAAGAPPVRADLLFGSLEADLTFPESWAGRSIQLSVEPVEEADASYGWTLSRFLDGQQLSLPGNALLPTTYRLRLAGRDGPGQVFWAPGTSSPAQADTVRLGGGERATYRATLAITDAVLQGSLVGE